MASAVPLIMLREITDMDGFSLVDD